MFGQEIQIGCNPFKRFANLPGCYPPLDSQTIEINGAIPAISEFDVNVGWRMVVKVHHHSGVIEALQSSHDYKYSATVALWQDWF